MRMTKAEAYVILELKENATKKEIDSAFREKAKQHHPDKAKEHFVPDLWHRLKSAYQILSGQNPEDSLDTPAIQGGDQLPAIEYKPNHDDNVTFYVHTIAQREPILAFDGHASPDASLFHIRLLSLIIASASSGRSYYHLFTNRVIESTQRRLFQESKSHFMTRSIPWEPSFILMDKRVLQKQLVSACELGDEKKVNLLLSRGARPDQIGTSGKHPLGAAIWKKSPEIIKALIDRTPPNTLMTWKECVFHNKLHYGQVHGQSPVIDPQIQELIDNANARRQTCNFSFD